MKKRLAAILLALAMLLCATPAQSIFAAGTIDIADAAVYHTPKNDYRSGDCILTASKCMIRRALIKRGSKAWADVTNKTLRKKATIYGLLLHNFTFEADGLAFTIGCGNFTGKNNAARIKEIEKLLKQHPEGIVVWGRRSSRFGMHGVLATGVKNGVVYAADSFYNTGTYSRGIQKWPDTSMKAVSKVTKYWYIKKVGLAKKAPKPKAGQPIKPLSAGNVNYKSTLTISDHNVPVALVQGRGYSIGGVINSNYRIKRVEVGVYNSAGKAITSKVVNPNAWSFDISDIDWDIKFGSVPVGSFKYKISATDEKKTSVLVNSSFTVEGRSDLKIKSFNKPKKIKKGKAYSIKGKISSNNVLTNVTIRIIDSKGKTVLKASAKPEKNTKTFNIKKLDNDVTFGKLQKGTYHYRIEATDTVKTKTLVNHQFKVW